MNITARNFFRLLRAGLFGQEEPIEPMSAWKWQQLYGYACMHHVSAIVLAGIERCSGQFFLQLPEALRGQWKLTVAQLTTENEQTSQCLTELTALFGRMQLRPIILGGQAMGPHYQPSTNHHPDGIDIFFPFETQGKKADQWAWTNGNEAKETTRSAMAYQWEGVNVRHHHRLYKLSNTLHSRTLQNITEEEFRESQPAFVTIRGMRIEVPSPTLQLLHLLLSVAADLLTNGLVLSKLADIAVFLRKVGDKVDFVKLQTWIERIRMKAMAQLEGELLVHLLHLTTDEIPFMTESKAADMEPFVSELFKARRSHEWHFQQAAGDVFVSTVGSKAMFWQVRHSAHYFRYFPTESAAKLMATFAHSLSHIEE